MQTAVSACPVNWDWLEHSSEAMKVKKKVSEFGTEMHKKGECHK
jgi:hypothetical protein